jgi:hypothetical protein
MSSAALPLAPDLFVIQAISPERQEPESEDYSLHTRLNNGQWEPTPMGFMGIHEVRSFLQSSGVDVNAINKAIEELSSIGQTTVSVYQS